MFIYLMLRKLVQECIVGSMTQQPVGVIPEFNTGDRLRKARELTGLDQGPFAELIGVSRGTVSNYERGTTETYRPIVMRAWSMATGVPMAWLEAGIQPTDPSPDPTSVTPNDALRRLTASKASRSAGSSHNRQYGAAA